MFRRARRKGIDKVERERNDDPSNTRDLIDASPRAACLISRVTDLVAAATLVAGLGLSSEAAAQVSGQPPGVTVTTLTPERIAAALAVLVGLTGAIIGGLALARSAGRIGTGNGRRGAILALVMGPIGLVMGGVVVATADGGLGTGNGLGGAMIAMVVGLIGMILGGLALARFRRSA